MCTTPHGEDGDGSYRSMPSGCARRCSRSLAAKQWRAAITVQLYSQASEQNETFETNNKVVIITICIRRLSLLLRVLGISEPMAAEDNRFPSCSVRMHLHHTVHNDLERISGRLYRSASHCKSPAPTANVAVFQ
nr:hypothetical protein CFP56_64836 [Quercus suber]